MTPDIEPQLAYKVLNAPVRPFPYPHLFVENVFPDAFYAEIQANIPHPDAMTPIAEARPVKGYKERFVLDPASAMEVLPESQRAFWSSMNRGLRSGPFRRSMISKFRPYLEARFKDQTIELKDETLLVEDITRYALGPHSDAPNKVVTVLFYLPADMSQTHLGTSIYQPRDSQFSCQGGPHYGYEGFERVATMPFLPNSMFAFVKSDKSFHGVEPVTDPDVKRWLLLYDIKIKKRPPAPAAGG